MRFSAKNLLVFAAVAVVLALAIVLGTTYLRRSQELSLARVPPKPPVTSFDTQTIIEHNAMIRQKPAMLPYAALAGPVSIRGGFPRYWISSGGATPKDTVYYPIDSPSVTVGATYREYAGNVQIVKDLDSIGNGDTVYLTYYHDRSRGFVCGIVRSAERTEGSVSVRLLKEYADLLYLIPAGAQFSSSDPSLLFDLKGKTSGDIAEGNILCMEYTPQKGEATGPVRIAKATLKAPPYRMFRGSVEQVEKTDTGAITLRINSVSATILADQSTVVYTYKNRPEMGLENYRKYSKPVGEIKKGKIAVVYAYIAGDRWKALAVGLDAEARNSP